MLCVVNVKSKQTNNKNTKIKTQITKNDKIFALYGVSKMCSWRLHSHTVRIQSMREPIHFLCVHKINKLKPNSEFLLWEGKKNSFVEKKKMIEARIKNGKTKSNRTSKRLVGIWGAAAAVRPKMVRFVNECAKYISILVLLFGNNTKMNCLSSANWFHLLFNVRSSDVRL